jgi:exonuclease VII small subunit
VEAELAAAKTQAVEFKKKTAELEGNLGKMTNDKLNLETEIGELKEAKEALEQATKKRR